MKYIPELVTAFVSIQDKIPQSTDPLFENLKNAWGELIPIIKDNFGNLLEIIINSVMRLIENSPKVYLERKLNNAQKDIKAFSVSDLLKEENNDLLIQKSKTENLSTAETSDYAGAIELLNTIIEMFGVLYIPYYSKTEEIIISLLSFENEQIRIQSSNTLVELISLVSKSLNSNSSQSDKDSLYVLMKKYIVLLFTTLEKEPNNEATVIMLDNLCKIIEKTDCPFLSSHEINELCEKLLHIFEKIERYRLMVVERKKQVDQENVLNSTEGVSDDEEEVEEDDYAEELQKDIDDIEDVLVGIADVFGSIFKTHKERTLDVVNKLKNNLLLKYFTETSSVFEKKMGLFIIDDMAEFLGQGLIPNLWEDIISLLLSFCGSKDHALRQASAYGLGEIAKNTVDEELFKKKYGEMFFNTIWNSMVNNPKPKDSDDEEDWGYAKDNFTVSIGKIIKSQGNNIELEKWVELYLKGLPVVYDEDESIEQHLNLIEFIDLKPEVVLGKGNVNLHIVLCVLAEIYESQFSNKDIDLKIKALYENIRSNSVYSFEIEKAKGMSKGKVNRKLNELLSS